MHFFLRAIDLDAFVRSGPSGSLVCPEDINFCSASWKSSRTMMKEKELGWNEAPSHTVGTRARMLCRFDVAASREFSEISLRP